MASSMAAMICKLHDELFEALHDGGCEWNEVIEVTDDFFSTGVMVVALEHIGKVVVLRDIKDVCENIC